ncbi:MAG: hypothetical protein L6R38_008408 [Xanthoria sp. 2 TBL-2021]|nr:MAG: hypothetical protein L6R38_008408 [Xanthoria sp. 2 TBL-2021]
MEMYEQILSDVEDVTRQGMLELEKEKEKEKEQLDGVEGGDGGRDADDEEEEEEDEGESSAKAVERCRRQWWICQAYVRPLPKEALKKGSLKLGKKALKKLEAEEGNGERNHAKVAQEGVKEKRELVDSVREGVDERDGVPKKEMAKEAMQQQQTPMHAFDLAMKLCTTKHRHSKRQLTPQRPQTTQCNGFSLNYFLAGINNAASHYSVFPVCPNTLPNSTRTSTTSSLQHLGTSARTPLRLAPVGGTAEVRSSATEVAARAAESSSALGVDNRAAGIAGIGNLGGGRRVWRRVLGEGTVTEAALAAGTASVSAVGWAKVGEEGKTYVVLGTTMSGRATAAVEVSVGSGTGAFHTALGASANIYVGDLGGIGTAWAGASGRGASALSDDTGN